MKYLALILTLLLVASCSRNPTEPATQVVPSLSVHIEFAKGTGITVERDTLLCADSTVDQIIIKDGSKQIVLTFWTSPPH